MADRRYAATFRRYRDDGTIGPLEITEFETVEEATLEALRVFALSSTFAAWLRLPSGASFPITW